MIHRKRRKTKVEKFYKTLAIVGFGLAIMIAVGLRSFAFNGPTQSGGSGSGAIGVAGNGAISIGTSTPQAGVMLTVVGSTTNSSAYGLNVFNSALSSLLSVRNDGLVSIPGTLSAGAFSASLPAGDVSAGQFGSLVGSTGNFYFPSGLGIGTTNPALKLDIANNPGNGYLDGIAVGQESDNAETIQTYIDTGAGGGWGNWSYAGGCCNTLNIQPHGGNVNIGGPVVLNANTAGSGLTVNGTVTVTGAGIYNANGYQMLQGNASDWLRINQGNSYAAGTAMYGNIAMGTGGLSVGTWGTAGVGNIQAAGTIKSSAGGFIFPDNTVQTTAAAAANFSTLNGGVSNGSTFYFLGNKGNGSYLSNNNTYAVEAYSGDGGAAAMSFHRGGYYAVNFGLDPDNVMRIGGWSAPANRWQLDMNGNETLAGGLTTGGAVTIAGGTGKLTVGTVDPAYTINGEKYATYSAGMVGQKEEVTGNATLSMAGGAGQYVIDFKTLPKGSDLWLFSQTTDLKDQIGKMAVLLTPGFDGTTWYRVDPANEILTIYGRPVSGADDLTVSYRLTAPRFDAASWTNARTDGATGFIINTQ